ncbi:MAG: putative lipase [Tannerellaceae bacterium]|jgi:hypothetical protein|nr:putative lipase [Tannerellaceae bacterium]
MKHKISILLLAISSVMAAFGQNTTEYTDQMNGIFQNVDKSRISTGLLYDYGLQLIDPIYYDGTLLTDSNYVDMDVWKTLYWGVYSSKVNNNVTLQTPDQVAAKVESASGGSLAVMHIKYDKYKDNAVNTGLIRVQNDQIFDIAGKNPYEQKMLFAIAPNKQYFGSLTVSFMFNSNLHINNTGKTIRTLQVNFNNESGYKSVNWNTDVSHRFSSEGVKDIYLRITYTDNTIYTARTRIAVAKETDSALRSDSELSIAASSYHSGGTIQIKYSSNNTSGRIRKPLIVAEGFDPGEVMGVGGMDITSLYDEEKNTGMLNTGSPNIWSRIQYLDYDVVYLDYNNGLDDIRRNARLFQEVIEYVNTNKTGGQPNVVLGISMGGLVARYALRKMEIENKEHDTWKYISMDSPHKGANIPLGVQACLRHLINTKISIFFINVWGFANLDAIKKARTLLDSKAAKQMLIYYVGSNGAINNTEHNSFQTEYDNMGFPVRCENIALTDGSGSGTQVFVPGTNLVDFVDSYKLGWFKDLLATLASPLFLLTNYPNLFFITVMPGKSQIEAAIKINSTPNRTNALLYHGKISIKKSLWFIKATKILTENTLSSNSSIYPVDGAPGGIYDIRTMLSSSFPPGMLKVNQFTFIPTVSAMALSNWQTSLTSSLRNQTLYPNYTQFVRNYMPTVNAKHTSFAFAASFMNTEISVAPLPVEIKGTVNIISNKQYDRDIFVRNGGVLTVSNNALLKAPNRSIIVENGGRITLNNGGKIESKLMDINLGGTIESNSGTTVTIQ